MSWTCAPGSGVETRHLHREPSRVEGGRHLDGATAIYSDFTEADQASIPSSVYHFLDLVNASPEFSYCATSRGSSRGSILRSQR